MRLTEVEGDDLVETNGLFLLSESLLVRVADVLGESSLRILLPSLSPQNKLKQCARSLTSVNSQNASGSVSSTSSTSDPWPRVRFKTHARPQSNLRPLSTVSQPETAMPKYSGAVMLRFMPLKEWNVRVKNSIDELDQKIHGLSKFGNRTINGGGVNQLAEWNRFYGNIETMAKGLKTKSAALDWTTETCRTKVSELYRGLTPLQSEVGKLMKVQINTPEYKALEKKIDSKDTAVWSEMKRAINLMLGDVINVQDALRDYPPQLIGVMEAVDMTKIPAADIDDEEVIKAESDAPEAIPEKFVSWITERYVGPLVVCQLSPRLQADDLLKTSDEIWDWIITEGKELTSIAFHNQLSLKLSAAVITLGNRNSIMPDDEKAISGASAAYQLLLEIPGVRRKAFAHLIFLSMLKSLEDVRKIPSILANLISKKGFDVVYTPKYVEHLRTQFALLGIKATECDTKVKKKTGGKIRKSIVENITKARAQTSAF